MNKQPTGMRRLSPREIECAKWIAKELTNKQIAKEMAISTRTVEGHIENIKRKMRCYRKEQLVEVFSEVF
jgi:DNA-binding CsgD family transcriptional regulator